MSYFPSGGWMPPGGGKVGGTLTGSGGVRESATILSAPFSLAGGGGSTRPPGGGNGFKSPITGGGTGSFGDPSIGALIGSGAPGPPSTGGLIGGCPVKPAVVTVPATS